MFSMIRGSSTVKLQTSLLLTRHPLPTPRPKGPINYWQASTPQPHRPTPPYRAPTSLSTVFPILDPQPKKKRKPRLKSLPLHLSPTHGRHSIAIGEEITLSSIDVVHQAAQVVFGQVPLRLYLCQKADYQ